MDEHQPQRPSWLCAACQQEWPCVPARNALLAAHGPGATLCLRMAGRLIDATADNLAGQSGELHQRFLGWARR